VNRILGLAGHNGGRRQLALYDGVRLPLLCQGYNPHLDEGRTTTFGRFSSHLRALSRIASLSAEVCRRHQTPIGDLLGVLLELGASDGGGSGELITVPVLTAGPGAGGTELE